MRTQSGVFQIKAAMSRLLIGNCQTFTKARRCEIHNDIKVLLEKSHNADSFMLLRNDITAYEV